MTRPVETLSVDGIETSPEDFAVSDMHLSSARLSMSRHEFALTISREDLLAALTPEYDRWLELSRQDDEAFGGCEDDISRLGYPSLPTLVATKETLRAFLDHELLRDYIRDRTGHGPVKARYWLHKFTDCDSSGDQLRFSGVCYGRISD